MSSPAAGRFQDHYELMGLQPDASTEVIQKAYTDLAAKFNPRNKETGDKEMFENLNFAYETLIDPQQRKLFDSLRAPCTKEEMPKFTGRQFFEDVTKEVYTRQALLCILYDRRRLNPISPAISVRLIDKMIETTQENFELAIWYLKQRGLVVMDDKSRLNITVEGIDYVVANASNPDSIMNLMKATALVDAPVGAESNPR